jgi:predicted phosphodiesterase
VYYLYNKPSHGDQGGAQSDLSIADPKGQPLFTALLVSDMESDYETLRLFVKEANNIKPDAIFVLGDITSLGVKSDMLEVKKIMDEATSRTYYVPGDRDLWKSSGIKNFKQVFGSNYGLVDLNGIRFLLIDNANEYEGIDSAQYAYITENLPMTDFLLFHNPIYFNSSLLGLLGKGMGQYSPEVNQQRMSLLDEVQRSPSIKGTFAGDQHSFSIAQDLARDDLKHVVVGSISRNRNLDAPNFVLLKVFEGKSFEVDKYYLSIEQN